MEYKCVILKNAKTYKGNSKNIAELTIIRNNSRTSVSGSRLLTVQVKLYLFWKRPSGELLMIAFCGLPEKRKLAYVAIWMKDWKDLNTILKYT